MRRDEPGQVVRGQMIEGLRNHPFEELDVSLVQGKACLLYTSDAADDWLVV